VQGKDAGVLGEGEMARVSPWFGWGFDKCPISGKEGLWNLNPAMVKSRMEALVRVEDGKMWGKDVPMRALRNSFHIDYIHKKRGRYFVGRGIGYCYVKTKNGTEVRLDLP
jgi:hypothetical protein